MKPLIRKGYTLVLCCALLLNSVLVSSAQHVRAAVRPAEQLESGASVNSGTPFELLAAPPSDALPAPTTQSTPRLLMPETEIVVATVTSRVQENNQLLIEIAFRNVTTDKQFRQLTFGVNARTSRVTSSIEPTVTAADLGGDGILSPASTGK